LVEAAEEEAAPEEAAMVEASAVAAAAATEAAGCRYGERRRFATESSGAVLDTALWPTPDAPTRPGASALLAEVRSETRAAAAAALVVVMARGGGALCTASCSTASMKST
jgi:hypothetical protein